MRAGVHNIMTTSILFPEQDGDAAGNCLTEAPADMISDSGVFLLIRFFKNLSINSFPEQKWER